MKENARFKKFFQSRFRDRNFLNCCSIAAGDILTGKNLGRVTRVITCSNEVRDWGRVEG